MRSSAGSRRRKRRARQPDVAARPSGVQCAHIHPHSSPAQWQGARMVVSDAPTYICARRVAETASFWAILDADHAAAPAELQALSGGAGSVPCRVAGAETALAWAKGRAG